MAATTKPAAYAGRNSSLETEGARPVPPHHHQHSLSPHDVDFLEDVVAGMDPPDLDFLARLECGGGPSSLASREDRHHAAGSPNVERLKRAMEIITTSGELENMDSEQSLIQVWYPPPVSGDDSAGRHLRNVVLGCTTTTAAAAPQAVKEEEVSQREGVEEQVSHTLSRFGERSKLYKFEVDGGLAEGLPGRVFVSGRPEMTLDVQRYGVENYLRINEARNCGIRAAVGIPVYAREDGTGRRETVAVVEISKVSEKLNMERLSCRLADIFESVDLFTWGRESPSVRFGNWPFNIHVQRTSAVLNTLVEAVCRVPGIEYVATWGRATGFEVEAPKGGAKPPALLSCDALPCGVQNASFIEYRKACGSRLIYENFGFVGRAWGKNCSVWHSSVSSIPWEANPYTQFNVASFPGGVVAVPLTLSKQYSNGGEDTKYILELFISALCTDIEQQRVLIVNMLTLLIKIGGGRFDIGVLLEYLDTDSLLPGGVARPGQARLPSPGGVANAQSPGNEEDDQAAEVREEAEGGRAGKGKGVSKKSISLQMLQKHFKYNLKEAARRLGVCPTTLKRVCRQHNIPRWPCRRLKKVNRSMNKLQGVMEACPGVNLNEIGFPNLRKACMFNTSSSELSRRDLSENKAVVAGPSRTPALEVNSKALAHNPVQQVHYVGGTSPIPIPVSRGLEYANPELHHVGSSNDFRQLEVPGCGSNQLANGLQARCLSPPTSDIQGNVYQSSSVPDRTVSVKASYCGNLMRFALHPGHTFEDVISRISSHFNLADMEVHLKYLDEENDFIWMKNDQDLVEARDTVGRQDDERRIIRVRVEAVEGAVDA
ncbi:RWP-RK domain-containing protein [Chloropicon primus]|uniref:RWP-RK domain-containing protein n=1 Tax=Chloropicon primus TaxID=1764295 RepID=A0A5B8MH24_9CHLO|nr:hypothetical protein A3770_02p11780 [Chloropicon primus]UPQ97868.1 RWP-RK domain-containing protein [Chloropicon primus]|eukprot:QDZ18660.1 hypothetical protein A3770_02p11780 [Chloropicon primus]